MLCFSPLSGNQKSESCLLNWTNTLNTFLFQSPFGESKIRKLIAQIDLGNAYAVFQSPFGESKIRKLNQLARFKVSLFVSVPFRGIKNKKARKLVRFYCLTVWVVKFQSPFGESKIRKCTKFRSGVFSCGVSVPFRGIKNQKVPAGDTVACIF